MPEPRLVMTLLVRDEIDAVGAIVEHYLDAGIAHIIATDNGSIDGTREVLSQYQDAGVLTLIDEPAGKYLQDEWVTRMARMAAADHGADWVINADADEFLWPLAPSGVAVPGPEVDLIGVFGAIAADYWSVTIRRDNLIADPDRLGPWPGRLVIRDLQSLSERGTRIAPKSAHRAAHDVDVAFGNHASTAATMGPPTPTEPLVMFHVPDRSFAQYRRKIENGGAALKAHTDLSELVGWHWRLDHDRLLSGELESVWRSRQPGREEISGRISAGTAIAEPRLLTRLQYLRDKTVLPGILDPVVPANPAVSGESIATTQPIPRRRWANVFQRRR